MLKNLLILGDSYSTFEGYIPEGYRFYYSVQGRPNMDVTRMTVDQTWWKRVIDQVGGNLVQNNSWSGSTVCYTSLNGEDCSQTNSFIYRYKQLYEKGFFDKNEINTVIVFGTTNDSWGQSPLGEPKYADWTEQDLYSALPAVSYLNFRLKNDLPNARIIFIINTGLKQELVDAIQTSAKLYGTEAILLKDFEKDMGHPNVKGMQGIAEQVVDYLNKNVK